MFNFNTHPAVDSPVADHACPYASAHEGDDVDLRTGTLTGHVLDCVYYSPTHGMHYAAEATTTIWELAPDGAIVRLWDNGRRTISSCVRGSDPLCGVRPSATRSRERDMSKAAQVPATAGRHHRILT